MKQIAATFDTYALFEIEPNTRRVYGIEKGTGCFIQFDITGEQTDLVSDLKKGDTIQFEVEDIPTISQHNYPVYKVLNVIRSNGQDIDIDLTKFPRVLRAGAELDEQYEVKGILKSGPDQGQEVTINCTKDTFINFIKPIEKDGIFRPFSPSEVLHTKDVSVCLTKGEPVVFKNCLPQDDGTYECQGTVNTLEFDATATVKESKYYKGYSGPNGFSRSKLNLTVVFDDSHMKGKKAEIMLLPSAKIDFNKGIHLKLKGLHRYWHGSFSAQAYDLG